MFNNFAFDYEDVDKVTLRILSFEHDKSGKIKVTELLDESTGEIFSMKEAKKMNINVVYPDTRKLREYKMNSLRKEVREFAEFILKFRSKTCGFLVEFSKLVEWYAYYTNKNTYHVRRYIEPLLKAGILDSSEGHVFLHKDFMINKKNISRKDELGNPFRASHIFSTLLVRKKT